MSYSYQGLHYEYKYEDDSNHGDDCFNEYDQYSDHAESAYSEHPPSEPDYYEEHKGDTQYHDDKNHEDGPEGCEYEHGELKYAHHSVDCIHR